MIKLQIEDATLLTLDKALLPHVQWKSIRICDLEGVDTEVLNTYLSKMSKPIIKSLIKNNRVNPTSLSTDQWLEVLEDNWDILNSVQLPYNVIKEILEFPRLAQHYGSRIARTQDAVSMEDALKWINVPDLNQIMVNSSNPGLRHFMFTDEGIKILKTRDSINYLHFLTTEEFNKIGKKFKNRTISIGSLTRADACHDGKHYCSNVLKELNRDSITWDEAIIELRTNPELRKRRILMFYMEWIYSRCNRLDLAE